jgi:peptidoglycan/LPS O-acetylase OafA/YrhL
MRQVASSSSRPFGYGYWSLTVGCSGTTHWFSFCFLAVGAIIALVARSRTLPSLNARRRAHLPAAGEVPYLNLLHLYIGCRGAAIACIAIVVALLGMSSIPPQLIYLGRMSYGLYVFYIAMLQLSTWIMSPLHLAYGSPINMCLADGIALALAICLSRFSRRYFEAPFLRLKAQLSPVN